ncbi:MAG: tryptophan synthase subunit alpha [Bacteroidetes bacterium]|jgi:tryptophan synthase alpha chain|nr:tryptophan synthase subunit alpha [Bacteroidota bacterium]
MNELLQQTFNNKKGLLAIYFTAGYPSLESTKTLIQLLDKQPIDIIEIGIPFSDPLADGPVIQESSRKALQNGMNLKLLFSQLKQARKYTRKPLILMGYFNPVLQFGLEKFLYETKKCGINGLILPDLPPEIYERHYRKQFTDSGIPLIFLVSPQSSDERIHYIDKLSSSFIYAVSSASTTGSTKGFDTGHLAFFKRLQSIHLRQAVMVGFGINSQEQIATIQQFAKGAIIGSAFIRQLDEKKADLGISEFFNNLKNKPL